MSLSELSIEHRHYGETLVATRRFPIRARAELPAALERLTREVPANAIAGQAFVLFHFVTSVADGSDVEVGVPVSRPVETSSFSSRWLPALEVLALRHTGARETLRESYAKLYGAAYAHGLVSDEFCREVYHDIRDPDDCEVEVEFVVHNWNALLAGNVERVLGAPGREAVMQGSEAIDVETPLDDRFHWVKGALQRLEGLAGEGQTYDVLSSCAHVFPAEQVAKLGTVYREARVHTGDPLQAVDAVLAFMDRDPGWPEGAQRAGRVVYAAKGPRNPQAHEKAQSEAERKEAYCFCPILRRHLDRGMPPSFCYCGAGWYRRQWEGALGQPVAIEVVSSILKGDEVCQFAIYLPGDL